jgi:hypothetical protein
VFAASASAVDSLVGTSHGVQYWHETETVTSPPGDGIGTVSCPAGTKVSGGGFSQSAFAGVLNDSFPLGKSGWAVNVKYDPSGPLETFAICNEGGRSVESKQRMLKANKTRKLSAGCDADRHVIGGGALISGALSAARLNSSYPFDSKDAGKKPDDGWRARGVNLASSTLDFEAFAICANRQPTYKRTKLSLGPSGTSGNSVFCPPGKVVLSGGIKLNGPADETEIHFIAPRDGPDAGDLLDDGWLANAGNEAGGTTKMLTAFALCD